MSVADSVAGSGEALQGTRTWLPADDRVAIRGTLVVLPGRGEHGGAYERFGLRLAADGYAVHALTSPFGEVGEADGGNDGDDGDDRGDGGDAATAAIRRALGDRPAGPVVLVGSDTGALQALPAAGALHAEGLVQGVVLAGLPLPASFHEPSDTPDGKTPHPQTPPRETPGANVNAPGWEEELAARTSCPTHRARLSDDPGIAHGALFAPVPARLTRAASAVLSSEAASRLPALVVHGGADAVSPVEDARAAAAALPRAEFVTLLGGTHDVLNDAAHRSVAAAVVQWLERLRGGGDHLADILTVEAPVRGFPRETADHPGDQRAAAGPRDARAPRT
jgi:alpha-beta hydrolase superfamily lysophospholipase